MSGSEKTAPGHVGNLTAAQEENVRQLWKILIESWDKSTGSTERASVAPSGTTNGRFSLMRTPTQVKEGASVSLPPKLAASLHDLKTGPNEISAIQSLLPKFPGEQFLAAYLGFLKQDHPDAVLLRYLRAEKWDVSKAWIKLVSALNWRANEYKVDEEVMPKGEPHAVEVLKTSKDASQRKDAEGFMRLVRTGEGHVHGTDKEGRPILVIRAKLHDPSGQTPKGMNDFVIHLLETIRVTLVHPVETITILFDMGGFGYANWDLAPIKFIVDTFQSNYPECLGAIIYYNAPWGLLDPVVASKVRFQTGVDGLEELIPRSHIIKELGGEEDWEFEYLEPQQNENAKLQDTATRDNILAERKKLGQDLFAATLEWTQNPQDDTSWPKSSKRDYWRLDPYIRSRTILDRTGVIQGGGKVDFYPPVKGQAEAQSEQYQPAEVHKGCANEKSTQLESPQPKETGKEQLKE
ncbi:hypothetical protein N7468_010132 [Penicillium chermesinum]|uniref:CRAL-TRIO domain-containing protein n=1 Tax=Penicillium chermesinum TaxID=63820 RepID=A0A9W9NC65_9EURO|nr:uncharacterized protein N7468_010132 [Penicillium chermesinum]KAJ5217124.1 hypothetical protein N7468_010132 [Penicillium chermesinum]